MGLDIKEFKGADMVKGAKAYIGNPDRIRESEKKRIGTDKQVDIVIDWEKRRLQTENEASNKRAQINNINKAIGKKKMEAKKAKEEAPACTEELEEKSKLEQELAQLQKDEQNALVQRDIELSKVGNIVHETVPVFESEDNNVIERTWGIETIDKDWAPNNTKGHCIHHQVLAMIDGYDPKRGHKVAGHRGFYLKGAGFLLNQALIQFGVQFLAKKGYTPIQPPYFMKTEVMGKTAQLSDFDEQLYKISEKHLTSQQPEEQKSGEQVQQQIQQQQQQPKEDDIKQEYYMIATSEQPISAMHSGEQIDLKKGAEGQQGEAIKYCGYSTNFRKEAGSSGKENWGIFRVHQFEKIEQFIICRPEDSWKIHEEMTNTASEFLQALGLPHQIVNIVSGGLNDAAAKKYDIEAWFPGYGQYKELMSVSNCTDYQSRALQIRLGAKTKDENIIPYVHMLNGTLCATQRTLTCILENYQREDHFEVPEVLRPFVGTDKLPYVNDVPKVDLQEAKK